MMSYQKSAVPPTFSIVDGRSGFWQVKLDDESNKLCTFRTPWTKYRWRRLPFGLTYNGDVFKEWTDTVFGKLDGLSGIADDPFIYGKSEQEHDQHILNVLDTARDNNFTVQPRKSSSLKSGKMATIVGDVTGLHQRELRNLNQDEQIVVFQRKKQDMDSTTGEGRGEWAVVLQC